MGPGAIRSNTGINISPLLCADGTNSDARFSHPLGEAVDARYDMSAEVGDMPFCAQASGGIDFVLAPDKITDELRKVAPSLKIGAIFSQPSAVRCPQTLRTQSETLYSCKGGCGWLRRTFIALKMPRTVSELYQ